MFWLFDFTPWFAPTLVFVALTRRLPRTPTSGRERQARTFWAVAEGGLTSTAWVSWFHAGAARNVFLPACLAASVMAGFTLASFRRRVRGLPASLTLPRSARETRGRASCRDARVPVAGEAWIRLPHRSVRSSPLQPNRCASTKGADSRGRRLGHRGRCRRLGAHDGRVERRRNSGDGAPAERWSGRRRCAIRCRRPARAERSRRWPPRLRASASVCERTTNGSR